MAVKEQLSILHVGDKEELKGNVLPIMKDSKLY